jgi:nucleotide-binding universal stress UspA family protein
MVVVDESPESDRAIYFASRRAARTGAGLVMLRIVEPADRDEQWRGVAELMRQEQEEEARIALSAASIRANGVAGITPECVVREGEKAGAVLGLIDEDEDISILVLAAGTGADGPGPLVSMLSRAATAFPVPVAIVPGNLTDDELDALS